MANIVLGRTGQKMPLIGMGLWKIPKDSCADTVYDAIKTGYRLFDGAGDYGNEKETGDGIQKAIKDGLVKREELFITSKLWNTFHAKEHVKVLAKKQLAFYGIDSFDLFLVHFPISLAYVDPAHRYPPEWHGDDGKVHLQNTPLQETWQAMEELVDEGLAKNIGLSNCQGSLVLDVLRYAKYPPAVLQIEHHPYLVQQPLIDLCYTLGIAVTAYSSLGPQSFLELGMGKNAKLLIEHDVVTNIATKHGKTTAQVLLRWATQQNIAVIPKSNNPEWFIQNLHSAEFDLTRDEIKEISALDQGLRFNNPGEIDPRIAIFA